MRSDSWPPRGPVEWGQIILVVAVAFAVFGGAMWLPDKIQAEISKSPQMVTLQVQLDGIRQRQESIIRKLDALADR